MCGIAGFTHCFNPLPTGVLHNALRSIAHRGPDNQSGYGSPHISLGSARLRIVDLDNGDQPIHSLDGRSTIVFNGEIYNHAALRQELEEKGRSFRTQTDTEVVLNAYLEWGKDCFARLRGMFAVAIWSEPDRRLVLARDRIGIKPLYYRIQNREIFFGSELKAIFAHPEVPRKIDLDGLNCYLGLNYVPGPNTLIEGITKLMPGHLLEWRRGNVSIKSYLRPFISSHAPTTLHEAAEELDALLLKAVAEQTPREVPMGIWLSGGMDSSTIAHYAAQTSSSPLRTFSITFRGHSFDEAETIRAISSHYGTRHTELDLNEETNLAENIQEIAYYSDEPSADAGAIPVWYLAKMTKPAATVALSGEGADELFGGYLTYKADRYRRASSRIPTPLLKAALRYARLVPASDEKIGFDYKLKRFIEGSMLSPTEAHVFWNGTFSEREKEQLFHFADRKPLADLMSRFMPGHSMERFLDFDRRYSLPDALLYKVDRMSMAHAVEARPPFLDDRIVDFAARLPHCFKIHKNLNKVVLRELMRDKLPQSVLNRPKIGLDIPIHKWFRGVLRPLLLDNLNESAIRETGLFHWPALARIIEAHDHRKANWGYHLWGLMTLMIWIKLWKIETPADLNWQASSIATGEAEEFSSRWPPLSSSA